MVRLNWDADPGAVEVEGGAEKVRVPREPELEPPPIRASAAETASTAGSASERATAIALRRPLLRCMKLILFPITPRNGDARKMGTSAEKERRHEAAQLRRWVAG